MGSRLHGNDGGGGGWVPVCTGTTVGWEPGIGSRCHGNDGGGLGSRGWVPVCTGRRWWIGEPGMGSRLSRERRWWVAGFFTPHLPAGGHVGPPLRLVTRASPSSHPSPAPRRGGRVSNPPLREPRYAVWSGTRESPSLLRGDSGQAPPSPVEGEGVRAPFHSHYSVVLSGLGH